MGVYFIAVLLKYNFFDNFPHCALEYCARLNASVVVGFLQQFAFFRGTGNDVTFVVALCHFEMHKPLTHWKKSTFSHRHKKLFADTLNIYKLQSHKEIGKKRDRILFSTNTYILSHILHFRFLFLFHSISYVLFCRLRVSCCEFFRYSLGLFPLSKGRLLFTPCALSATSFSVSIHMVIALLWSQCWPPFPRCPFLLTLTVPKNFAWMFFYRIK